MNNVNGGFKYDAMNTQFIMNDYVHLQTGSLWLQLANIINTTS